MFQFFIQTVKSAAHQKVQKRQNIRHLPAGTDAVFALDRSNVSSRMALIYEKMGHLRGTHRS